MLNIYLYIVIKNKKSTLSDEYFNIELFDEIQTNCMLEYLNEKIQNINYIEYIMFENFIDSLDSNLS